MTEDEKEKIKRGNYFFYEGEKIRSLYKSSNLKFEEDLLRRLVFSLRWEISNRKSRKTL